VRSAGDAFGTNIGSEQIGLYSGGDTRGFSPQAAGNVRLEGMYIDIPTGLSRRLVSGSKIRVGLTAQSYPFPAPTGIIDYSLRPVGDQQIRSLYVQGGAHFGYSLEYDVQQPIVEGKLGIAYGAYVQRNEDQAHDYLDYYGVAIAPRWRPSPAIEVRPFYTFIQRYNDRANAQIFAAGPALPKVVAAKSFTPAWTDNRSGIHQYGVMGGAALDDHWALRAIVFGSQNHDTGPISDSYLNTDANGVAQVRRFANQRPYDYSSLSGEVRLTGVFTGEAARQTLNLQLRGRKNEHPYGGGAVANYANVAIGQYNAPPEPTWVFGPRFKDAIRQYSAGASYQLAWRDRWEAGVGVQKTDYQKTLVPPTGVKSVGRDKPLLWNGGGSLNLTRRLAAYGAFTRGLEEAPVAPEVAVNAFEPPPAIHTRQTEFGLRYVIRPKLRLVVGYFDVQKPYFNLDGARVWRELGVERHTGVETSLTGELLPGLNVVAGYVYQEPRVSGEAVNLGLIGDNPVGQPRNTGRFNIDYRFPQRPAVSIDAALNYYGGRPISSRHYMELGGRQLAVGSYALLDLGMRYRFTVDKNPATLRLQVVNAGDVHTWTASTSGGLYPASPRRYAATLTTDF